MIIGVSDSNQYKFSGQLIEHWEKQGHEVRKSIYHEPDFVKECDAVFYDFADGCALQMSKEGVKAKKCIVRGIDIDLYAKHFHNINYDLVDHFIVLCDRTKKMVENTVPEKKLRVIQCGVSLEKFTLKKKYKTKKAVFVGRLWIGKNVAGAIDVVTELNRLDPGWTLHIRGERFDPVWWEDFVMNKIKLAEFPVTFDDPVADMNEYLEDKDLSIISSYKEAFSYAGAEALAKGIPAVFADWPEARDLWPGYTYSTPRQAADLYLNNLQNFRDEHRAFIKRKYDEQIMFSKIDALLEA